MAGMNAQNIISELDKIHPHGWGVELKMKDENKSIVEEIFDLAREVEPTRITRLDNVWEFWLWTDKGSYEEYSETYKSKFTFTSIEKYFKGEKGYVDYEKMKEQWPILFPEDTVWFRLELYDRKDDHNKLIHLDNRKIAYTGELGEYDMGQILNWILEEERKCVDMIKKGIYSEYIESHFPLRCRSGVTKKSNYWKYVPEDKERIFGDIDPKELVELKEWDKNEGTGWKQMTSNDYFEFCNILYDLLDLKTKYPIKKDSPDGTMSPKDYYMAYAANYDSSKKFKELDGDSAEAFDKFVTENLTEDHTWEVCLVPNIHLYPRKNNENYFILMSFEHAKYDLIVHLALEMRKRGVPVMKPSYILREMEGEELFEIVSADGKDNWRYFFENGIEVYEKRRIPEGVSEEIYNEIQWIPLYEWRCKTE